MVLIIIGVVHDEPEFRLELHGFLMNGKSFNPSDVIWTSDPDYLQPCFKRELEEFQNGGGWQFLMLVCK